MSNGDSGSKLSTALAFILGIVVGLNAPTVKKCLEPFIKGTIESVSAFSTAALRYGAEQKEWLEDIIAESDQVKKLEK